ncbi:MAG: choice-of-anchor tandem repeat GloVer-containing protein [Mariniphaga sp.]
MTMHGGDYNNGVLFKMDEDASSQEVVFSFEKMEMPEGGMTEYEEGVFYGTTTTGFAPSFGMIYRFESATGGFTKVADFDGTNTGKDAPGKMVLAPNGMLYGMTASGGAYDNGVLFEFDPVTETLTKKFDFNGQENGGEPLGSLILCSDGDLYGITSMGGEHDAGIIFSYDFETNSFTRLMDFGGGDQGANPMGSLTEAADGFLYGMTRWGGLNDYGVIFKFDRETNQMHTILDFNGSETGRNPHGSLTGASNGKLYGMTPFGGPYNKGVIFEFDPNSNTFSTLHNFHHLHSYGSLIEAPDKKLYGVYKNALDSSAMIFSFDPDLNTFSENGMYLKNLRDYYGGMESLTLASNGKLFFWGRDYYYIEEEVFLFEYDYEMSQITDYYSNSSMSTGGYPRGKLVQTAGDRLFGLASRGGKYDHGVVFAYNPITNAFKKVVDFDGAGKGAAPTGSLILAENSKLYGITGEGGTADKGVLYELEPVTGAYKKILDFDGLESGGNPAGDLIQATNGNIYGMTISGGSNDNGTLFEFDPVSGTFKKLIDFDEAEKGYFPLRSLVQADNGKLYGVTKYGGAFNNGMLFEYTIETGIFRKIIDSNDRPVSIIQASNNNLYISGYRSVFEYNPENSNFRQLENIDAVGFIGELFEVSEDLLWGMDFGQIAYHMGTEDGGMVFEINLKSGESSVKSAFKGLNGKHPEYSGLIKLQMNNEPVVNCTDTILYLDETGKATLLPDDVIGNPSGNESELSVDKSTFTGDDIGENIVVLTLTDSTGNTAACSAVVTVTDTIPPEVVTEDIEVYLDASGMVTIEAADVDNGSNDACGIESMALDATSFSCENIGENRVELSVTDVNGNSSTGIVTVTVSDSITPLISATSGTSFFLEPYNASYKAPNDSDLNATATDNCGIQSLTFRIEADEQELTGSSLADYEMKAGTYTIEWEALDKSGNVSSVMSEITIEKRPVSLLVLDKETNMEKQEVLLKAVLVDDLLGKGIKGKTLLFTLDEFSKQAATDENGEATVTVPLKELPADTYHLAVNFAEDDTYASGSLESEIISGAFYSKTTEARVYPNPFSEKLFIEFVAHESANARIDLYDSSGRLVENIFNEQVQEGSFYKAEFAPHGEPAGLYIYRMRNGNSITHGKVVLKE